MLNIDELFELILMVTLLPSPCSPSKIINPPLGLSGALRHAALGMNSGRSKRNWTSDFTSPEFVNVSFSKEESSNRKMRLLFKLAHLTLADLTHPGNLCMSKFSK